MFSPDRRQTLLRCLFLKYDEFNCLVIYCFVSWTFLRSPEFHNPVKDLHRCLRVLPVYQAVQFLTYLLIWTTFSLTGTPARHDSLKPSRSLKVHFSVSSRGHCGYSLRADMSCVLMWPTTPQWLVFEESCCIWLTLWHSVSKLLDGIRRFSLNSSFTSAHARTAQVKTSKYIFVIDPTNLLFTLG